MSIKHVLLLDIDEHSLKAGVFSYKSPTPLITMAGSVPLNGNTPEEKAEKLKSLLTEMGSECSECVVSLSRHHVTSRILSLPSTDPKELQDMISFQATKLVPFSKDEVILDYVVLDTNAEGFSVVHVLLCPKNLVFSILKTLAAAELNALSIRLNIQEMGNFHQSHTSNGAILLQIEADTEATHFFVQTEGKLLFSRSCTLPKKKFLTSGPDIHQRLSDEISNSITLFEKEFANKRIQKILFHDFPHSEKLKSFLNQQTFKIPFDFTENHYPQLEKAKTHFQIPASEISLSTIYGMSQNIERGRLNFLPKTFDTKIEKTIQQKNLLQFTAVLAGFILLACGYLYYKNIELDRLISQVDQKTAKTKSLAAELISKERKIEIVYRQQNPEHFALNILSEIYRLIPKEVSLDSLVFDQEQGVFLKGTAFTLSDAVNLIPKFESSNLFETVTSKGTTTKKIKNKVYTDFQLELPYAGLEVFNE